MQVSTDIRPTPMQAKVLAFRKHANIGNFGGRGGGKSTCGILDVLDHVNTYGHFARPLVLRESHVGMQEIQGKLYLFSQAAFGQAVSLNKQDGTISYPNGATVSLSNISDLESYAKHQGKSYTMLLADEYGNYPLSAMPYVNLLRSNLRVPVGMRAHCHFTGNPHGRSHGHVVKHHIAKAPWWQPYKENGDGDWWVNASSTLEDNPHIDRQAYRRQIKAATQHDEKLQKAWLDGDWSAFKGGMFDLFDPVLHIAEPPKGARYRYQGAVDWGTASPSVVLLLGELLEYRRHFRPGDIFVLGEIDTCPDDNDLSVGDGSPPSAVASMARTLCELNQASSVHFVVDDARGIAGPNDTVVNVFNECGIWASRPYKKNRVAGWALMRQLLQSVIDQNGPGLFISPKCPHLIETMQMVPRDDLFPEDIARKCNIDHHIDAARMGVDELFNRGATNGTTIGGY